jgi:hypothetical protein
VGLIALAELGFSFIRRRLNRVVMMRNSTGICSFLTGRRLADAHRRNLVTKAQDTAREISIFEPWFPAATSAIIATSLGRAYWTN